MGILENITGALGGKHGMDISKMDLPMTGDNASTMNELISKGAFKNKSDFVQFLATAYMKNNMGAAMSGGQAPPESKVMDIITSQGLNKGFSDGDIKTKLVPLLITGFMAIHKYMGAKKHTVNA